MVVPLKLPMKLFFILLTSFIYTTSLYAQQINHRPKIGLTLSGGGAKGLAHIGILKAIDSAALKIDYITGTSMGAIIGALYAVGYSGKQIEKIAEEMDWDILLSNQVSLRSISMEEKAEYGKYAIELPYINRKLHIPGALLEGQELWLKLAELFYPVYNIQDFNHFSIPFKCIAADIVKGEAVVLSKGDITAALRSSMAIPTVFNAVDKDGKKLVDGGVVRNFPVRDVIDMGAEFVIGSSVTTGLSPKEKLNSAIDILLQLAFFKEAEDYKNEIPLCDIYISQPLENYSMGSFNNADNLIEAGIREGDKLYPQLKQISDSLNRLYGSVNIEKERLPGLDSVFIKNYEIIGLKKTRPDFFIHSMGFHTNQYYSQADISKMMRRVFSTRYYNSINYSLDLTPDGSANIIFTVNENPSSYAKLGIHYNDFSGIGLIANLTTRDFFTPNSRSLATVNIGENLRIKGEHLQFFGIRKDIAIIPTFQLESFKINTYTNFSKSGQYRQLYYNGELKAQFSGSRRFTAGIGTRYEWIKFKPLIQANLEARGKNDFFTTFTYAGMNTLDKSLYPKRGVKINAEYGRVYNQRPNVTFFLDGDPVNNPDSIGINYDNYQRMEVSAEAYVPISKRLRFYTLFQSGINFNYRQNLVNNFQIGGLVKTVRNQILFAGLDETTVNTPSVASLMVGLNLQIAKNIYLMAKTNALVNNFISADKQLLFNNWLTGHAIIFAYNTPIGPLEFSLMYSDQSKKALTYVNFGIPF